MEASVSIWDFEESGAASNLGGIKHKNDLSKLEEALKEGSQPYARTGRQRLFIVQTPSQCNGRHPSATCRPCQAGHKLRQVLETSLHMPQDMLNIHQWNNTTFRFNETINCPRLPTICNPRRRFSIEYFEMWQITSQKSFDHYMKNAKNSIVQCAATGRDLQCHKWSKTSEWLLIAPRKCSFWSERHGYGWNAVILCDPPPRKVMINGLEIDVATKIFEGGYHGFIPDHVRGARIEAPPHTSLFDDINYYIREHSAVLGPVTEPESAAVFLRKIAASHYCQLLGFVSHQTASMRSSGWAVQRRTQQEIDEASQVESAWSHFKCPEYFEALSHVLDCFGIPHGHEPYEHFDVDAEGFLDASRRHTNMNNSPVHSPGHADWRTSTPDLLYLHREFRLRLADYARMTSSLAALNGMIGGRLSILEARTARTLTLVAMLFAPPACVASIFSIPTDIFGQEGGPPFWWYWAATVPLTVIVFLLTYLVHERDFVRRVWNARKPRVNGQGIEDEKAKDYGDYNA
ncbi:hypothetical protein M406DRAFT_108074 [Cryphonectria parasitica EP155]|uniref:Uncharacterized protein n=1 Tax=Cryphonectria parasitica (strain ATCC 38755 / EP155) TaxID=660469 RepID=A0A9P5CL32_CRYP1|nr:uncharacterized protein M406DRAFT_108074 [Cryphonectria parasitica EP155]KAF3762904.1 hypothetical protein M406DRAFT_108074 [Cryphonectria parasitica EP155]